MTFPTTLIFWKTNASNKANYLVYKQGGHKLSWLEDFHNFPDQVVIGGLT